MTPHYADPHLTVYCGDAATVLATLPAESVHCVVTSPPYWGLRNYGVPGQLGLERTPEEYVERMVGVFREVRRVLRRDGTLWLNMGDSYRSTSGHNYPQTETFTHGHDRYKEWERSPDFGSLKPKDLVGIPWRLAFALQADGWYLRSDIIWSKPNPMPESVTDRPTKSHEHLFLLSPSARYYYDAEAVREPHAEPWRGNGEHESSTPHSGRLGGGEQAAFTVAIRRYNPAGRNRRTVWTIATEPYPGAHFATFPQKLVEPCILAGTSERGVCPECGAPWRREVARARRIDGKELVTGGWQQDQAGRIGANGRGHWRIATETETTGWHPTCAHDAEPSQAVVLDPFAGTGTTGLVANRLGRRAVLIDLSTEYMAQLLDRNRQAPLGLGT